jgi:hypothetical protein
MLEIGWASSPAREAREHGRSGQVGRYGGGLSDAHCTGCGAEDVPPPEGWRHGRW